MTENERLENDRIERLTDELAENVKNNIPPSENKMGTREFDTSLPTLKSHTP